MLRVKDLVGRFVVTRYPGKLWESYHDSSAALAGMRHWERMQVLEYLDFMEQQNPHLKFGDWVEVIIRFRLKPKRVRLREKQKGQSNNFYFLPVFYGVMGQSYIRGITEDFTRLKETEVLVDWRLYNKDGKSRFLGRNMVHFSPRSPVTLAVTMAAHGWETPPTSYVSEEERENEERRKGELPVFLDYLKDHNVIPVDGNIL